MDSTSFEDPRLRLMICRYVRLEPGEWTYSSGSSTGHRFISLPYWRLYWNAQPGARIHHHNRALELKPSNVVLVSPHTIFSTSNSRAIDHFYVHFQLPSFYYNVPTQVTACAVTRTLLDLIRQSIRLLNGGAPSPWRLSLIVRALVELALSTLMDGTIRMPRLDPRVLTALSFLDENLETDLSNALLAERAGMSADGFNRLFKAQMGRSLQAYARLKRLEKACMMLLSDSSIKEIAEATGFCDRYHFSRVFRRVHGIGPAEFRRTHQPPFIRRSKTPP
ncbi:MAG: helix-turn-helix domain-containing protein [Kiritimatiellae bacterium]|nr:helix-turn-helix domain-containing protein [Kiritimatiellia bacterium]